MSKCKCRCECCRPDDLMPWTDALNEIDEAVFQRALSRAVVVSDRVYDSYRAGLMPDTSFRDTTLYERGVENRVYHSVPIVPRRSYVEHRRK